MGEKFKFEISTWTVVKIVLILILFYLLFLIRDIIALFFVVMILAATFSPIVASWAKKITRPLAVIAVILIFVAVISLIFYLILPPLINETTQLFNNIPLYLEKYYYLRQYAPSVTKYLSGLTSNFTDITSGFIAATTSFITGVIAFIMAVVLLVYFLVDEKAYRTLLINAIPVDRKENISLVLNKVAGKVGSWFRGQLLLGLIIGIMDLIGLLIIGIPYAVTLAVLAAFLEIIPTIGPIVAGVTAALVALTISPWKALFVVLLYLLVSQIEATFLVPKIMQKAVGLSPIIIIFAMLVGARLMGAVGAVLAIPIAASLSVVFQEWPTIKAIVRGNAD